mmetsp:Transcript_48486/g.115392  ORF Transcript_48486/g.115392 Transcript_48486/m.115392 type:complete len:234 (+) Transcript_48486:1808-2509(+)
MSFSIWAMSLYTGRSRPKRSTPPCMRFSVSRSDAHSFFHVSMASKAFSIVSEGSNGPSSRNFLRCVATWVLKSSRPCMRLPFIFSLFEFSVRSDVCSIDMNFENSDGTASTFSFSSSRICTSNFSSSLKWSLSGSNRASIDSPSPWRRLQSEMRSASSSRFSGCFASLTELDANTSRRSLSSATAFECSRSVNFPCQPTQWPTMACLRGEQSMQMKFMFTIVSSAWISFCSSL